MRVIVQAVCFHRASALRMLSQSRSIASSLCRSICRVLVKGSSDHLQPREATRICPHNSKSQAPAVFETLSGQPLKSRAGASVATPLPPAPSIPLIFRAFQNPATIRYRRLISLCALVTARTTRAPHVHYTVASLAPSGAGIGLGGL